MIWGFYGVINPTVNLKTEIWIEKREKFERREKVKTESSSEVFIGEAALLIYSIFKEKLYYFKSLFSCNLNFEA